MVQAYAAAKAQAQRSDVEQHSFSARVPQMEQYEAPSCLEDTLEVNIQSQQYAVNIQSMYSQYTAVCGQHIVNTCTL